MCAAPSSSCLSSQITHTENAAHTTDGSNFSWFSHLSRLFSGPSLPRLFFLVFFWRGWRQHSILLTAATAWHCAHPSPDTGVPWTFRGIYCASRWRPGSRIPSSHRIAGDLNNRAAAGFWGSAAARSSHRWDSGATVRHRWCAAAGRDSRPASAPSAGHTCRDLGTGSADPSVPSVPSHLPLWPVQVVGGWKEAEWCEISVLSKHEHPIAHMHVEKLAQFCFFGYLHHNKTTRKVCMKTLKILMK